MERVGRIKLRPFGLGWKPSAPSLGSYTHNILEREGRIELRSFRNETGNLARPLSAATCITKQYDQHSNLLRLSLCSMIWKLERL